jgi:DNA-binding NarL/FixJ family response regulator
MQVFLVEDSAPVRDRLVQILESLPGIVLLGHASNAESAIRDILAAQPDVVLLDVSLASGSGFDVLRAVRPQAPQIDFYLLSNFAAFPYRQLAATLGARDFFDKSKEFERACDAIAERASARTALKGESQCLQSSC